MESDKKGRPFAKATAVLLLLVGLIHGVRLLTGTPVTVGERAVPVLSSLPAALATLLLAVLLWRESTR